MEEARLENVTPDKQGWKIVVSADGGVVGKRANIGFAGGRMGGEEKILGCKNLREGNSGMDIRRAEGSLRSTE